MKTLFATLLMIGSISASAETNCEPACGWDWNKIQVQSNKEIWHQCSAIQGAAVYVNLDGSIRFQYSNGSQMVVPTVEQTGFFRLNYVTHDGNMTFSYGKSRITDRSGTVISNCREVNHKDLTIWNN